jgi:hypothetical protein
MTIEEINNGALAYKYLRGSWSHGIGVEGKSDYDYGGVYIAPIETILGLRSNYEEQVQDKKGDEVYYELGRWFELLLKSNPTALESLFIDKKFVIGEVHPIIQNIINNREKFLSKDAFNPLVGYAVQQIKRATGYNKKCNIPEDFQRKDILDFCYTFKDQGSQPIKDFLKEHKLDQKYCGLVKIPNMCDGNSSIYGVYYDFAAYWHFENKAEEAENEMRNYALSDGHEEGKWVEFFYGMDGFQNFNSIRGRIKDKEFFGYSGIVHPNEIYKSNDVRLSSIPKGEVPICTMTYNKNAYERHCREYKDWTEWKKNRNEIRYSDNKGYNFDAKNMCETVRLIHTGIELARAGESNVERTWDRDLLLNIKNHKVSYDEISAYVKAKKEEFDALLVKSTLPEHIDYNEVNELLIGIRKKIYNI